MSPFLQKMTMIIVVFVVLGTTVWGLNYYIFGPVDIVPRPPIQTQTAKPSPTEMNTPVMPDDTSAQCGMKPDPGPCKAIFTKYYYDQVSQTCEPFTWGGCQGVVPFETKEECQSLCK